ncbi:MAG: YcxB family protein [Pseudobutyrivibrio sp.]|nr:YcxB family protein [Pseudobutyrivibrio sp.]
MKFSFVNDVRPSDFWLLSMLHTYSSLVGLCNVIFTVAMFGLCYRFWNTVGDMLQVFMILACSMFIVIQPLFVYMRSKAQAAMIPRGMTLGFDDNGLHIVVGDKSQEIDWSKLRIAIEKNAVFVRSDEKHGYMLTNRMLGKNRQDFIDYASSQIARFK